MKINIETVLEEILEHTKDCDYNRSQHFSEREKYKKRDKWANILQMICLMVIVIFYMIISEFKSLNQTIAYYIPVVASIIATVTQLYAYFSGCGELAERHWLAAQAYTRLYREC